MDKEQIRKINQETTEIYIKQRMPQKPIMMSITYVPDDGTVREATPQEYKDLVEDFGGGDFCHDCQSRHPSTTPRELDHPEPPANSSLPPMYIRPLCDKCLQIRNRIAACDNQEERDYVHYVEECREGKTKCCNFKEWLAKKILEHNVGRLLQAKTDVFSIDKTHKSEDEK